MLEKSQFAIFCTLFIVLFFSAISNSFELSDDIDSIPSNETNNIIVSINSGTSYSVEIVDIPQGMTTLNCDSIYPEIRFDFHFVKTYNKIQDGGSSGGGKMNLTYDNFSVENVAAGFQYRCILFSEGVIHDEVFFEIIGDVPSHNVTDLVLINDWDRLSAHVNISGEYSWARVVLQSHSNPSHVQTRFVAEDGTSYIGGIYSDNYSIGVLAADVQGNVNQIDWYEFYTDSERCDYDREQCPQLVALTPES